ncbi:ribonuclease H-like domain-containing protein [Tanacetum coccineum]
MWTESILIDAYLSNSLPSSVLNRKSPFELPYGLKPKLSHLRSFRCLCFSSILKNSNKFSARSEKCVLIGFSTTKKAYKKHSDDQTSSHPNDDGRGNHTLYDDGNVHPCSISPHTSDPIVRMSSRSGKMLAKFNDYVVGSSVKSGVEKFVSYFNLSPSNYYAKIVDTPLPKNTTLNHIEYEDDKLLSNIRNYQKLVGKLIYLTNTRLGISSFVHCLSQYMHAPLESHLEDALRVLRSSAEAKYKSMAFVTCEVIWLSNLLNDMGVKDLLHIVLYCDNRSTIQITANLVFHEKSKHFKFDVHLVREKVAS